MTRLVLYMLVLGIGLGLGSCIDRYTPDVAPADQANLVVDGFINPQGRTVIKLSRTFSVNTQNTAPAETRAQLAIQDDAGQRYPLTETTAGTYTSAALVLDPSRQYQLRITTSQARDYASDLLPVVVTPPIDSLTWQVQGNGGIELYVSTHDARNATRFYRWEYEETYQFTSALESTIEYVPSTNRVRPRGLSVFWCWRTEASTAILQANTTSLAQDVLVNYPLTQVLPSVKLRIGYSLLVRQTGQTQAEYAYWETLRNNTENLGTVNDPLPARVTGNVHALADAAEPVLGYVGVHSVTEKRLFIDAVRQLPVPQPGSVLFDPAYAFCIGTEQVSIPMGLQQFRAGSSFPVKPVVSPFNGDTVAYLVSSVSCVDCRQRGTNVKPSFWP